MYSPHSLVLLFDGTKHWPLGNPAVRRHQSPWCVCLNYSFRLRTNGLAIILPKHLTHTDNPGFYVCNSVSCVDNEKTYCKINGTF